MCQDSVNTGITSKGMARKALVLSAHGLCKLDQWQVGSGDCGCQQ